MKINSETATKPLGASQLRPGHVYARSDREDLGENNVWLFTDAGAVVRLWDGFSVPAVQCGATYREVEAEVVVR